MEFLSIPVKTPEFRIYPVCDVQLGGMGCDLSGFQEYIDEAMADPQARFVGVGDYTDGISPSNRKHLKAAFATGSLYDTPRQMFDEAARDQMQSFLDIIKPTRGKWDFLLEGHHFWEYIEQGHIRTTDQDIADWLGCRNLGVGGALVTYKFKTGHEIRMYARHGEGSGDSLASPLTRLEKQMRAFECDIYLTGHHHKLVVAKAVKLQDDPEARTHLAAKYSHLVAGGSWLNGFVPGEVSYAEAGMMVPLATGGAIISVQKRKRGYRVRVTI